MSKLQSLYFVIFISFIGTFYLISNSKYFSVKVSDLQNGIANNFQQSQLTNQSDIVQSETIPKKEKTCNNCFISKDCYSDVSFFKKSTLI